ncbi:MAG: hypothetical protein QXE38_00505, partial [Candidatus Methanomethylicia archaeon]
MSAFFVIMKQTLEDRFKDIIYNWIKKIEENILKNYSVEDLTKMTGKTYERLISNGSLKVS